MNIYDASSKGNLDFILENKDKVNGEMEINSEIPLNLAIQGQKLQALQLLLNLGADVNSQKGDMKRNPLINAVLIGNEKALDMLLKYGASLELKCGKGLTALDYIEKKIKNFKIHNDCVDEEKMQKLECYFRIKSRIRGAMIQNLTMTNVDNRRHGLISEARQPTAIRKSKNQGTIRKTVL